MLSRRGLPAGSAAVAASAALPAASRVITLDLSGVRLFGAAEVALLIEQVAPILGSGGGGPGLPRPYDPASASSTRLPFDGGGPGLPAPAPDQSPFDNGLTQIGHLGAFGGI